MNIEHFALLYAIYLLAMFVAVFVISGRTIKSFKDYWRYSEGDSSIPKRTMIIFSLPIVLALIITGVSKLVSVVQADEVKWFQGGEVFVAIDRTYTASPFCKEKGINNHLNSNMGASYNIVQWDSVFFGAEYTHHSCAINPDDKGYDAIGARLSVRIP